MAEIRLNTVYITTAGHYLHHEGDVLKVERGDETVLRIPLHHVSSIVIMALASVSASLMRKCLDKGVSVSFLNERGRFLGCVEGARSGAVALKKEQLRRSLDNDFVLNIARAFVGGKMQNQRLNLMRSARDSGDANARARIHAVAEHLLESLRNLDQPLSIDAIRGYEGEAARRYFAAFNDCILSNQEIFRLTTRTRYPPRSRINAMLSFVYAVLTNDCLSALQASGLDPFIGFLHADRRGRASLALDLVEEFRPMGERLVFTLINRKQISERDFDERPGGTFLLNDSGRRLILSAYQERKHEMVSYPLLRIKCPRGEIFLYQAQQLARFLLGHLPKYAPYCQE